MIETRLGAITITTTDTHKRRLSAIIWGPSGAGKTTLAATAPRPILWLNFDPDGTSSLQDQKDILIADYSGEFAGIVVQMAQENVAGTKAYLEEHPEIQTVVFDSTTTFNELSLRHGVTEITGASMMMPGLAGYGRRNAYTMQAVYALMKLTWKMDKNLIVIAHEDTPQKDELSGALFVSILVGGKLQTEMPIRFSEIWYLYDDGSKRRIAVRSSRMRKPMKTRMFTSTGEPEFVWKFDADTWTGDGIETWLARWKEASGKKIPLPK